MGKIQVNYNEEDCGIRTSFQHAQESRTEFLDQPQHLNLKEKTKHFCIKTSS